MNSFALRSAATLICLVSLAVESTFHCRTALADPPEKAPAGEPHPSSKLSIYHSDPDHLWNRLHRVLWVRTTKDKKDYGHDRLDPYLWRESKHLLEGESHQRAIAVLDEFLKEHGEKTFDEPLKRALLQRDLWAVFDWTTEPKEKEHRAAARELQLRLAQVIQRVALSDEQIKKLPDNYAAAVAAKAFADKHSSERPERPFLPRDLLEKDGPWVEIVVDNSSAPTAPRHVFDFGARSAFRAFLRLPEGRKATLDYMKSLNDFPRPWLSSDNPKQELVRLSPALPQFPAGTQVALLRQMLLVDRTGEIVPTALTESLQLRVFAAIPAVPADRDPLRGRVRIRGEPETQHSYEFTLSRASLFAGRSGGLRPIRRDERDFGTQLLTHNFVEFESQGSEDVERRMGLVHESCIGCHDRPGIYSLQIYVGGTHPHRPYHLPTLSAGDGHEQAWNSDLKKHEQFSLGLLQGLWVKEQP